MNWLKNLFKNENEIFSWLSLIILLVLVVLSAIVGARLLAIQEYLSEFAENIETHIDEILQTTQASEESYLTPFEEEVSLAGEPIRGDLDSAEVLIIEFLDFECSYSALASETIQEIIDQYPNEVAIVHKDYPLPYHLNASIAAQAAGCAYDQDQYWEMHNLLFQNQQNLDEKNLISLASTIGLETTEFEVCLQLNQHESEINEDFEYGKALKISGTPAFIVGRKTPTPDSNSFFITGYLVFLSDLSQAVDSLLADS